MGNIYRKRQIKLMVQYYEALNKLSPFPLIDTEHIMDLKHKIKKDEIDYDMEPVVCCAHCKRLSVVVDEEENDLCLLCKNSINETETHATIFHYLNKYPDRWE